MKLTDATIRSLPFEDGQRDYPDHIVAGMFLRVGKRTKTFMLVVRRHGNRSRGILGRYGECSLSQARELARDKLAAARLAKDEVPSIKFVDALEAFYRIHGQEQRESTRTRCRYLMDKFFRTALQHRQLESIKPSDLAPVLDAIASVAVRQNTLAFLQAFFNWCYRRGYIDISPAARLEKPPAIPPRERVLTPDELRAIWHACPASPYGYIVKLCMCSGQRIGQWMQYRPEYRQDDMIVWPKEDMKEGKAHALPVTPMMAELLEQAPFVWKMNGAHKTCLDQTSGVAEWRHHDLRRTWATIAAEELDTPPHIIESVLAHAIGTTIARTYNRAKYLAPMRTALLAFEEWLHTELLKTEATDERR